MIWHWKFLQKLNKTLVILLAWFRIKERSILMSGSSKRNRHGRTGAIVLFDNSQFTPKLLQKYQTWAPHESWWSYWDFFWSIPFRNREKSLADKKLQRISKIWHRHGRTVTEGKKVPTFSKLFTFDYYPLLSAQFFIHMVYLKQKY